jgi:aryl-alcohol dehydrogenase-like predicted oxidoreductase
LKGRAGIRDKVTIFTKVGSDLGAPGKKGLSEKWILRAVDDSLTRLGIGEIDLYFSHWPDPETSYEETLGAFDKLLKAGKVRAIGASNHNVEQLGAALEAAKDKDLPAYQVLQPEYNLYDVPPMTGHCATSASKRTSASLLITASPPVSSPVNIAQWRTWERASAARVSPNISMNAV